MAPDFLSNQSGFPSVLEIQALRRQDRQQIVDLGEVPVKWSVGVMDRCDYLSLRVFRVFRGFKTAIGICARNNNFNR